MILEFLSIYSTVSIEISDHVEYSIIFGYEIKVNYKLDKNQS